MCEAEPDRDKTRQFMITCHSGQKCTDGSPYSRHPAAVAKLAKHWGIRHFRANRLIVPLDQITINDMWHAAMLHDTIACGGVTWDDILAITNLEVADLVAALSPDNRLSRPRRLQEYTNCLLHADYPVKIIKLADLCCSLQDGIKLLQDQPAQAKTFLEEWPDEVLECVAAINKLNQKHFKKEWTWCQKIALSLGRVFRRWEQHEDILREINVCPKIPKQARES